MDTKQVTLRLTLELRSRPDYHEEVYTCQATVPANRTDVEDFRPFILEKTVDTGFGIQVKRAHLRVDSYDPATETVQMSHSLTRSESYDFTYDLQYNYGWREDLSARRRLNRLAARHGGTAAA
ncbi:hypothetical protein [Hymenobacter psychrophilus]|uniref:Uncharacterized protein n=1 Tax=Hymenobacter psychrophilus TaxID=651662 RepID=A0A1H3PEJ5_9BACT|nr:hypothetical protein [Hymenobacter psychrophilus]SDY99225.1 hypothetical protein SAMN04488069_12912 [Hymenobacter psychrophilus]